MIRYRHLALFLVFAFIAVARDGQAITCPGSVAFEPSSSATLDAGFTGLAHGEPVLGWTLAMKITSCPSATASTCGTCTINGLIPNTITTNQRCANDTSIACQDDAPCQTQPGRCEGGTSNGNTCTTDANCLGGGICRRRCAFFTTAPTAIAVGGVGACLTEQITAAVTGSVDVEQGALTALVPLQTNIYLGGSLDNPCPRCIGDGTADDGVKGGTCNGGVHAGQACDAAVGVPERPDFGASSFDCPPTLSNFIGSLAQNTTPITVSTGTSTRTVSTANPTCTGFPGSRCLCETCNNAKAEPCGTNADCPMSGGNPGVCGGRRCIGGTNAGAPCTLSSACPGGGLCGRPGEQTKPNNCVDDTSTPETGCVDVGGGAGACFDGPLDNLCTQASGHPQRACSLDADCGGGAGSCQTFNRRCFLDNGQVGGAVSVTGTATPPVSDVSDPVELAGLFCLPTTPSTASNSAVGLPGLGRTTVPGSLVFGGAVGELTIAANAPPGSIVSSDQGEGDGATTSDPVETKITTSTGAAAGEVTIYETTQQTPPPSGYGILGSVVQITAPTGDAAHPMTFVFLVDSSVTGGQTLGGVELRRNGVIVPPCGTVPPAAISPDPCIFDRAMVGDDFQISAYTSAASSWDVVGPGAGPTATPGGGPTLTPTPVPTVTPGSACGAMPAVCRTPVVAQKASVALTDKVPDDKDQLQWQWSSGAATTVGDFGDPVGTDDYVLCVYDGNGLRTALTVPAGGTCAGKPCWTAKPTGFVYKDKTLSADGVSQIVLKAGAAGKAKIQVKGKGLNLPMPALATLSSPLTVQLAPVGGGTCFGATYSFPPATKNDGTQFKDKGD
jgi:hypothetical protein